jgi:hypothetical protein
MAGGAQILFRRRLRKAMRTPHYRGWGRGENVPQGVASVFEALGSRLAWVQRKLPRFSGHFTPMAHILPYFAGSAAPATTYV